MIQQCNDYLSAPAIAALFGVSSVTVRKACSTGRLQFGLSQGGHRRISVDSARHWLGLDKHDSIVSTKPRVCILCRTSTPQQAKARSDAPDAKSDLQRQIDICRNYVATRWGSECEVEENVRVASGLNFNAPEIIQFTLNLVQKKYDYVVITYKDRLARSSFDLFSNLARHSGTEIIMVEQKDDPTYTESLVEDLICLCAVAANRHAANKFKERAEIRLAEQDLIVLYQTYKSGYTYVQLAEYCVEHGIKGIVGNTGREIELKANTLRKILLKSAKLLATVLPDDGTSNTFQNFLDASVTMTGNKADYLTGDQLYAAYTDWCRLTAVVPLTLIRMRGYIKKQLNWATKLMPEKCVLMYLGVSLKTI